jgi:hypothetical protein
MSKRTVFTTITPLPAGISREAVLETLHDHLEMIDLNPSHEARVPIKPPPEATPEEYHCKWYQITDKVSYLPAGMITGKVHFKACFHDLPTGLQTHVYAPMGLDIKEKWTLGGNLPHEPVQPVEIGLGAPVSGLYLREDVDIKCNFLMTRFVRNTLKESLATLVARMVVKSQLIEAENNNTRLTQDPGYMQSQFPAPLSPLLESPRQSLGRPMSSTSSASATSATNPISPGFGMQMDHSPTWQEAHDQQQLRNSYLPQHSSQYSSQRSPSHPSQLYIQEQHKMQQQQQRNSHLQQLHPSQQYTQEQQGPIMSELDSAQVSSGQQVYLAELP